MSTAHACPSPPPATDGVSAPGQIEVRKTVTIARPPAEVYDFWRNLENLPRFMAPSRFGARAGRPPVGVESQGARSGPSTSGRPRSPTTGPGSGSRGARCRRRTRSTAASVEFSRRPATRGPKCTSSSGTTPPAGPLGAAVAKLFGGNRPAGQADLRRLKQVLEIGEVMHSDASIAAGPASSPARAAKGARS